MEDADSGSVVFATARLAVRHFRDEDAEALFSVCSDPLAMRWVGDGKPLSLEQCRQWIIVSQRNYRTRGFGSYALSLKRNGEFAGYAGIVYSPDQPDPEIIYALHRKHWRQGYATELVPALLAHGLHHCRLMRVVATIAPENIPSRRIVERAGMKFERAGVDKQGLPELVYVMERIDTASAASLPRNVLDGSRG